MRCCGGCSTRRPRAGAFTAADIERYVEAMREPGALTAALNYYRANRGADAIELAASARTDAHTLVLWGNRDPALHESNTYGLVEVAPKVRVYHFPDAGHWLQNEAPAEVNRTMLAFLNPDLRG